MKSRSVLDGTMWGYPQALRKVHSRGSSAFQRSSSSIAPGSRRGNRSHAMRALAVDDAAALALLAPTR
jgi:hypothetical protein